MAKHSRSPSDDGEETPSRGAGAKRRRATASVATKPPPCVLVVSTPSPWAGLTYGPAGLIAGRALANDVSDYVSFRAVCRAWRRVTEATAHGCLGDRRFYPHRWIMLREAAPPGPCRHRRRFLNVCTGQCVRTELPELDGHHLLGATTEGLLALLDESTYAVRLLNPATRQLAELPTLDPLLPPETRADISEYGLAYALKVTGLGLVGDGDGDGDDSALAISFFTPTMLVVAGPGDEHWTVVDGQQCFYSAMSFSGRFYCAKAGAVVALELVATTTTNQPPPPPRLAVVAKITCRVSLMCRDTVHLVESDGRLLLLRRWLESRGEVEDKTYCWIRGYKAYEVDLAKRETVPVRRGLRGRAVFLGKTRALSVSPLVFPTIRGNMVYPAADSWEMFEQGVGSYNLLNGRIERCNVRKRRNYDDDDNHDDNGWTRPCGIRDYLSWYVSGRCNHIEEI